MDEGRHTTAASVTSDGSPETAERGGSTWTAMVGGALFLALAAAGLYRGLTSAEAHVRPLVESLGVVTVTLVAAIPGVVVFAPVGDRGMRYRVAAFVGGALTVLTLPFGVFLAVPTYLIWRAGRDAPNPRGAGMWVGIGLAAAAFVTTLVRDSTMTCWVERVSASGAHDYIVLSSHNGVSVSPAAGYVGGGGCVQFPTVLAGTAGVVLALASLAVLLFAVARPRTGGSQVVTPQDGTTGAAATASRATDRPGVRLAYTCVLYLASAVGAIVAYHVVRDQPAAGLASFAAMFAGPVAAAVVSRRPPSLLVPVALVVPYYVVVALSVSSEADESRWSYSRAGVGVAYLAMQLVVGWLVGAAVRETYGAPRSPGAVAASENA